MNSMNLESFRFERSNRASAGLIGCSIIDELWNSYSYGDDEIDEVEAVRKINFQNSIAN